MEIVVKHNSVYLKRVNLGRNFSSMIADVIIDRLGRVKVYTESELKTPSFYTDLYHLPPEVLTVISKKLENEAENKILTKIDKRIQFILNMETKTKASKA